jgi:hypothetical protein
MLTPHPALAPASSAPTNKQETVFARAIEIVIGAAPGVLKQTEVGGLPRDEDGSYPKRFELRRVTGIGR